MSANDIRKLIPLLLGISLLLAACSTDNLGPVAAAPDTSGEPSELTQMPEGPAIPDYSNPYPALTEQHLADGPAPGFRFFNIDAAVVDGPCDSVRNARWCSPYFSTSVGISGLVDVRITRGDLSSWEVVSVVAPQACMAVADFYPHPYQFNGIVEITWRIKDLGLPRGFNYDSLIPFYVTDDGQYIQMPYQWRDGRDFLIVYTNHFSRYIVGQAING